jgi:hypothetical protein
MVRPCNNNNCSARVCKQCIKEQVNADNKICGNCRQPIIIKKGNFNILKCSIQYLKVIYTILLLLGGTILTFLNALGKTSVAKLNMCDNAFKPCDSGMLGVIALTIPFLFLFWQGHLWKCCISGSKCCIYDIFCYGDLRRTLKYKSYLTMTIMLFVSNLLIMFSHFIGYPIIKYYFHKDDFYTWRTSLAGYIIYIIIIAIIFIGWILYKIGECMFYDAEEKYCDDEYGVVIKDDIIIDLGDIETNTLIQ